jgi:hypothetical protein
VCRAAIAADRAKGGEPIGQIVATVDGKCPVIWFGPIPPIGNSIYTRQPAAVPDEWLELAHDVDALIKNSYTGSREGMSALNEVAWLA